MPYRANLPPYSFCFSQSNVNFLDGGETTSPNLSPETIIHQRLELSQISKHPNLTPSNSKPLLKILDALDSHHMIIHSTTEQQNRRKIIYLLSIQPEFLPFYKKENDLKALVLRK